MDYPSPESEENKWMVQEKIKSLYTSMVSDPDFDRLELGLKKPNIFDVLKVETNVGFTCPLVQVCQCF